MKKLIFFSVLFSLIVLATVGAEYSPPGYNNWTMVLPDDYTSPEYNNFTLVLGAVTPPSDTCTYSGSGNWQIDCDDFCNLTTNTNLGENNITINGTGTTRITGNLTNYTLIDIWGTDTSNKCIVECSDGGCFK